MSLTDAEILDRLQARLGGPGYVAHLGWAVILMPAPVGIMAGRATASPTLRQAIENALDAQEQVE